MSPRLACTSRSAIWLLLALGGASCRPAERIHPSQRSIVPPGVGAPADTPSVLTAPALPFEHSEMLGPYLEDLVKTVQRKRFERYGVAVEPAELAGEIWPQSQSMRFGIQIDPIEAHFNAGEELFETELSAVEGFGDGMGGPPPNMHRVHRGAHGGPDTTSCRSCHHRGGDDGAGEWTENALVSGDGERTDHALERNPPALHGGGAIQILAAEIAEHFQQQIRYDVKFAQPVTKELEYQGVRFGTIRIMPDGSVDGSQLTAIDADLVLRPFGWKGTHSTLRRFAEEALQAHHGMNSEALIDRRQFFGTSPFGGSPATRAIAGAMGDNKPEDPDQDQARYEVRDQHLSAMAVYLTLLPLPVIDPPRAPDLLAAWRTGAVSFNKLGCDGCHKPMWVLKNPIWTERADVSQAESPPLKMDLRKDLRNGPPLQNHDTTVIGYPIFPFSDFRRHDMGPELADPVLGAPPSTPHKGDRIGPQIPASYFLTRPLWGLADSGPYLHDGRALTLHDAIVAHGGEARSVRDAYLAQPEEKKRALHVFLLSLARLPLPEVAP
jgi:hypothetical protein